VRHPTVESIGAAEFRGNTSPHLDGCIGDWCGLGNGYELTEAEAVEIVNTARITAQAALRQAPQVFSNAVKRAPTLQSQWNNMSAETRGLLSELERMKRLPREKQDWKKIGTAQESADALRIFMARQKEFEAKLPRAIAVLERAKRPVKPVK